MKACNAPLADQIRDLVNAQGANEITITVDDRTALALARAVEWAEEMSEAYVIRPASVTGAIRSRK